MNDKIRIFTLGGLDEDGKNCTVIEINKDIFVVDCGVKYPDKNMPGIDYVIGDFTYLVENKDRVKAYFLLHGHEDQMGALAYLWDDVPAPIYGSQVTLTMFKIFTSNIGKNPNRYQLKIVKPTDTFKVAGREISFFQTAHNIAQSSGIAIATTYGNIVITGDFVVENNASKNYLHDLQAIARISEKPTLVLMNESVYAGRSGYTAPNYKLTRLIERDVKDAEGRLFIALFNTNFYNIDEVISLAILTRKKIIPYDEETKQTIEAMQSCGQLIIPRENYASIDDINRFRAIDIIVLLLGSGTKLYNKIALLAAKENENRQVSLNESDTFIFACPANSNTEIEATDALDECYRAGCHVKGVSKKEFLKMHASEEDLKMMISLFKPKYYIPVKGYYKDLLSNAEVALSMGINLNHSNVFLLENGLSWLYDEKGAHLFDEKIPHGDIMIDGIGVGDVQDTVIADRQKLAEGVVVLSAAISSIHHGIVAGPDVQIKGLTTNRDAEIVSRELSQIFTTVLENHEDDNRYDLNNVRQEVYDRCLRSIRRETGKEPMILPLIIEAD